MRVLIAAGGTAGHINPALAIAGAIKKADPSAEIHFAGRKEGMEYRLVTQAGYPLSPMKNVYEQLRRCLGMLCTAPDV